MDQIESHSELYLFVARTLTKKNLIYNNSYVNSIKLYKEEHIANFNILIERVVRIIIDLKKN